MAPLLSLGVPPRSTTCVVRIGLSPHGWLELPIRTPGIWVLPGICRRAPIGPGTGTSPPPLADPPSNLDGIF